MANAISSTPEIRLLRRFVRQWPIAVVGVIATVVLCAATLRLVPPSYSTKASLLLTPPPTAPTATTTGNPNPYMQLGGLQPLADVVSRSMMSSSSLSTLRNHGLDGSYTVARDTTTDGPIVTVTTKAKTPAAALKDLQLVINLAGPQLNSLQANEGVTSKNRVTTVAVARDTQAGASRKSQIRALVVALVGGLVITALAVSIVDLLTQRRRSSKQSGRTVRPLATAPATAEAEAESATASTSGRAMWRPRVLGRTIVGNGSGDLEDEPAASAPNGDSADTGERAVQPAFRARRRPLPGLGPDVPDASPVIARTRRRARGSAQPPSAVSTPTADPDDRVASRLP